MGCTPGCTPIEQQIQIKEYTLDEAYDSFLNHADIWYMLSVKPLIFPGEGAVINNKGEIHRIDHWINKMWKLGGAGI